jgi:hypothetical protein
MNIIGSSNSPIIEHKNSNPFEKIYQFIKFNEVQYQYNYIKLIFNLKKFIHFYM